MKKLIPQSAIEIKSYSELQEFAVAFANNHFGLLGVVGSPGIGKSESVAAALAQTGTTYLPLKGHLKAFILYQELWEHRNEPVLLDDADTLLADSSSGPLLKALLETKPEKTISWRTRAIDGIDIPRSFITTSRAVVICNSWRTVNQHMGAIEDRGVFLHFRPSVDEVHRQVGIAGWFDDDEVYELIGQHLHLIIQPSMRYYVKGSQMRVAGISDWQGKTLTMLNPDMSRIILVSRLLADESIATESERVSIYSKQTGKSTATYYRDRDMLLSARRTAA